MSLLLRYENWPSLLFDYFKTRETMPFTYGKNDCMLFAADWILTATGCDLATFFRGKYSTKRGAATLLKKYADGGLIETAIKAMASVQAPSILPTLTQRGDFVLVETTIEGNEQGLMGGICAGRNIAAPASDKMIYLPLKTVRYAWSI